MNEKRKCDGWSRILQIAILVGLVIVFQADDTGAESHPLGYYPVAGLSVPLRSAPHNAASIVARLDFGDIVRLLDAQSPARSPEGRKTGWLHVEAIQEGSKIQGWLLANSLARPEDFKPVQTMRPQSFRFSVVDHYAVVEVTQAGRYSYKRAVCLSSGLTIEQTRQNCEASSGHFSARDPDFYNDCACTTNGPVYRFRDIYWLHNERIFWIRNEHKFCVFYPGFPYCVEPDSREPDGAE